MNQYEIWTEGYRITGDSSKAQFHGIIEAESFEEACKIKFNHLDTFDIHNLTLWGCRIFDNQASAIKSFG